MPLQSDPQKHREWQERSRKKAQARAMEKMRTRGEKLAPLSTPTEGGARPAKGRTTPPARPKKARKHNDAPWRNACIALRGEMCRSCGDTAHVEMDHIIPKSQKGELRSDTRNGLPLCGAFSRNTPGGCHPAKTDGRLQFEFEWFDADQIEFLAEQGWVVWDENGQPTGQGMKHFRPRRTLAERQIGG